MEKELEKERKEKEKLEDNNQYRHRHFQWKDGFLHSYCPKNNIKRTRCYLYCWKLGCKAKVRVDMNLKKVQEYGEHMPHRSIVVDRFKDEYPGLADTDLKNIQYDIKGKERVLMWKILK